MTYTAIALTLVAGAALLYIQFSTSPQLQQSSMAQRISASAQQDVERQEGLEMLFAKAEFSRARPAGENPILVTLHVQGQMTDAEKQALTDRMGARLEREFGVVTFVQLVVLSGSSDD